MCENEIGAPLFLEWATGDTEAKGSGPSPEKMLCQKWDPTPCYGMHRDRPKEKRDTTGATSKQGDDPPSEPEEK
ncbi:hypothetical protein NDU88_005248 [Pleurodeles waltl]|uniref:Uncharacterized protein n=1 Tax=Pleurodeles waltl TaxID=8319 RepID=A0AAV7TA95_PLEWA|nr:hypothetical protein NDU88_005248 [Pleurodeles waltl]